MKDLFIISVFAVFMLASCTKQDSTASVATSAAIIPEKPAPVTQSSVSPVYPISETYTGPMALTCVGDENGGALPFTYSSTDSACVFYVQYLSDMSFTIYCNANFQLQQGGSPAAISDATFTVNAANKYTGNMIVQTTQTQTTSFPVTFQFSGDSLYVNWDNPNLQIWGTCDFGESIGQFKAVIKQVRQ